MNRGDTRLFLTIISTAFATAVLTLIISRLVETRDARVDEVSRRTANLELRMVALEARLVSLEHPAPPPAPPAPVVAPDPPICDEVACVLNNYEGACCAKYKKPALARGLPESLDRQMISDGVFAVKADVLGCADGTSHGQVKAHVKVDPDGMPTEVTIKVSPTPELGACVARVMQTARFERTINGGSFSYPFVF